MKRRTLLLSVLFTFAQFFALNAQTDVTDTYLTNASFDTDPSFAVDATGGIVTDGENRVRDITGWTASYVENSNIVGATFEYGTAATLNGYAVPTQDSESGTTGACLGVQASWGNYITYSQEVTLPAGIYTISCKAYNSHENNTSTQSLLEWIPNSGTTTSSSTTSFPVATWTADEITFSLLSETTGTIQIGVKDIAGGSGSNPRLFIDDLKMFHEVSPILQVSETSFVFSYYNLEQSFTIAGTDLTNDVTLTAPTGVTLDKTTITAAEANAGPVIVTVTATVDAGINGDITITCVDVDDQTISCLSGVKDAYYYIKQTVSDLNIGNNAGSPAVMTVDAADASQVFKFEIIEGETYGILSGDGNYLANSTANAYSTTYLTSLNGDKTSWLIEGDVASEIRLKVVSSAYIASDATDSGSSLYCDKAVDNANGAFQLSEAQAVIVNYVDGDGNELKKPRAQVAGLTTGETYTATTDDKADFTVGEITYTYDDSSVDNVTIADGNAQITLAFTVKVISADATLSDITLDAGTLAPVFDPEITNYIVTIPEGTTSINVSATTNDANATITAGTGDIDVSSGEVVEVIIVTAENGVTTKDYTITFSDCFEPYFTDRVNIINDPCILDINNFDGWGDKSITTDAASVYCGTSSGLISGGSFDYLLTGILTPSTTYRVRAMVNATSTNAQVGVYGYDSNLGDINVHPEVTGEWTLIDFAFTTGETFKAKYGLFYNNGAGSLIDNWELYEVNNDGLYTLTPSTGTLSPVFSEGVYGYELIVDPGTTSVTITGTFHESASVEGLDEEITLTDGEATATITVHAESGNDIVYTISISAVSSDATLSNIEISEGTVLNPAFNSATTDYMAIVPEGVTSVTITPTKGYDAATLAMTINGATSEDGVIDVTVESPTATLTVTAENGTDELSYNIEFLVEDNSCYTPYYDDGRTNYVPDPNMDDMSVFTESWGNIGLAYGDEAYCGIRCGKITGTDNGYPNGGSITTPTIQWKANTTYRIHAWVKTVDGTFNFGLGNTYVDGTNADYLIVVDTNNEWQEVNETFTTGANAKDGLSWFNNYNTTGLTAFIDNWEIFEETSTGISKANKSSVKVYPTVTTSVFTVEFAEKPGMIKVYSLSGQLIKTVKATSSTETIELATNGIYLVEVESNGSSSILKVIKK